MEKKIIAIVVALVLVVTAIIVAVVVSNNSKEIYVDEAGVAHWLYKDEEGNTKLNDDGNIVVYAVNEKGKRQKDKNGEYVTAVIDFPEKLIDGNTLETPFCKITMSKEWELKDNGKFVLKDSDDVFIEIDAFDGEGFKTVDAYLEDEIATTQNFINEIKKGYPASELKIGQVALTPKKLDCRIFEYKFEKEDGTVDYSLHSLYFMRHKKIYRIALICEGNSYMEYGKDIDLEAIVNANFVLKDAGNN